MAESTNNTVRKRDLKEEQKKELRYSQSISRKEFNKPVVIVIGTLGTGKSTVLNRLIDKDEFQTSGEVDGCTQKFSMYHGKDYDICDSMGLGDPSIDITKWMDKYNANPNVKGREIALVLLVVKGQIRPTN
jgi:predicted GTPase